MIEIEFGGVTDRLAVWREFAFRFNNIRQLVQRQTNCLASTALAQCDLPEPLRVGLVPRLEKFAALPKRTQVEIIAMCFAVPVWTNRECWTLHIRKLSQIAVIMSTCRQQNHKNSFAPVAQPDRATDF